jgi:hypothetical protein
MKSTRAKKTRPPSGWLENTLYSIVYHWKWGLSAFCLFLIAVYVVCVIADAAGTEKPPKYLPVEMISLSEEGLEAWCEAADVLAGLKNAKMLEIPGRSLAELIAWGRRNPEDLADALGVENPLVFLGLTLSIAHVRTTFRDMVEHEMRLEEGQNINAYAFFIGDLSGRFAYDETFELEAWEADDLAVYDDNSDLVEGALDRLLPNRPPLVPCWKAMDDAELVELGLKKEKTVETKPLSWRVISRSRYGPRILRKK